MFPDHTWRFSEEQKIKMVATSQTSWAFLCSNKAFPFPQLTILRHLSTFTPWSQFQREFQCTLGPSCLLPHTHTPNLSHHLKAKPSPVEASPSPTAGPCMSTKGTTQRSYPSSQEISSRNGPFSSQSNRKHMKTQKLESIKALCLKNFKTF